MICRFFLRIKPIKNSNDRFLKIELKLTSGNNRQLDPMLEETLIRLEEFKKVYVTLLILAFESVYKSRLATSYNNISFNQFRSEMNIVCEIKNHINTFFIQIETSEIIG